MVYLLGTFPVLNEHLDDIAAFEDEAGQLGEAPIEFFQFFGHLLGAVHRLRSSATELGANGLAVNFDDRPTVLIKANIVALRLTRDTVGMQL